jgi:hypothetical protein
MGSAALAAPAKARKEAPAMTESMRDIFFLHKVFCFNSPTPQ